MKKYHRQRSTRRCSLLTLLVGLAVCARLTPAQSTPLDNRLKPGERASASARQDDFNSAIQHVVFIIKENRSFDNYFGTYPNANGATSGPISTGQILPLSRAGDRPVRDLNHSWVGFIDSIDNGKMDGFDLYTAQFPCSVNGDYLCYSQLLQADIPNYWAYAQNFVLSDETFASETAPSYDQHIFTVAASSAGAIGNLKNDEGGNPGCDAPVGVTVDVLDPLGNLTLQYPCFDVPTLADTLDAAGVSWRYYAPQESIWNGLLSINHIRHSTEWNTNVEDYTNFISDVQNGALPAVSWLVPANPESEHPSNPTCYGENWTVAQINAIMQSPYWNNTAIFVTWDEAGGFYDHVPPPKIDEFGLSPRVPLLIIAPYAKAGYISHTVYEFSSFLRFVEERYNLPTLTERDSDASDMLDSFDFTQSPLPPLILNQRSCPVLSSPAVSFGPQEVGTTSSSRTVKISNYNSAAMTLSSIATTGDFSQTNSCTGSVQPPTPSVLPNCDVSVTFTPSASGTRTGTLTVVDSDASSPQTIQLSGVGTSVVLSPPLLSFGTLVVGTPSAPLTATLTNTGSTPVSISSITGTPDYAVSSNCGGSVAGGSSCTLTAIFSPTAPGKRYGALTVNSNDAGSPQSVNLTGIGTVVTMSPSSLTFPSQPLGTSSTPQSVLLTNGGNTPLTVSGISFMSSSQSFPGTPASSFSQTNDCGSSLGPGATCTLSVVFNPTVTGTLSATLNVSDSYADSPQQIGLTGSATSPLSNAVPFVLPLTPPSAAPGSSAFTLTVHGTSFVKGATINWNGTPLATTYKNSQSLTATVSQSLLATPGTARVSVSNLGPGGGISNVDFFPVASSANGITFSRADIPVETSPQAVVAADFNGDGIQDLAVANSGANTLSILLGRGDGTFAPEPTPVTGNEPVSLAVGDFNNDGKLDVAVGNLADNTVQVLLGNGDGTFTAGPSAASTVQPVSIAAGDFNQDGNLDVAVANNVDPTISILLGAGNGTLAPTSTPPAQGNGPTAVALGDFNRDGLLDVAEAYTLDEAFSVLTGNGDGTFKSKAGSLTETGASPQALTTGDFNGDGNLDMAVANHKDGTVTVFFGNGNATFQFGATYNVGANPVAIAAADLDANGSLDLVVSNQGTSSLSVLRGNGDGTFASHIDYATGTDPAGVALADFNGDGRMDVAVANSVDGTVSILLQGAPTLEFTPQSLAFGDQAVGTLSAPLTATLLNATTGAVAISGINVSGTNAGDFSETNDCPTSLQAAASCTVTVTFDPAAAGARSANISVSDSAPGNPQTLLLTGNGTGTPAATLSPTSLTFATQILNTTSPIQNMTLTNSGSSALNVTSISLTGSNSSSFSQTDTCGASVAAGANCTISVSFTPLASGSLSASVSVSDNAAGSPQTVPLTGTGTAMSIVPLSLNFGSVAVGSTSPGQTITVTNVGTASVTVTGLTKTGADASDFSFIANNCVTTLRAGASCSVKLVFKPVATGTRTATVSFNDNGGGSPQSVPLSGTGTSGAPGVTLSPTSLTFPVQLLNTSSPSQTVSLTNSGTATLSITSIGLTGTNASSFAQTNTCGASVAAGANCTISVTFKPIATGSLSASVSVTDNATGSPQKVSLTGAATAMQFAPPSLNFGSVPVGTNSVAQTVTVTNTSASSVTVSSITKTGTNATNFNITSNNCRTTLTGGGSCTMTLTFKPSATGTRTATLSFFDNGGASPQTVALTGTGT